jgi:hypothetical protein
MLTDSLLAGLLLALSRAAPLHTPPTDRVEVLPSVTLLCGDNNVSIQERVGALRATSRSTLGGRGGVEIC